MVRPNQKLGKIAFVVDERLSREKSAILTRIINSLRVIATIELISGSIEEDRLLDKLEADKYDLVFAPWYRYVAWSRIEAFYGLTRTSGPTFAGYFCEPILPYEIGETAEHLRAILFDFANLHTSEINLLVKMLIQDTKRSGLRPFFESNTPIYCENWFGSQGLGIRTDAVLSLPGILNTEWIKRSSALRICIGALWSLVYEEGPGKGEFTQMTTSRTPKAYFQIGMDGACLAMRLCYSMPAWSPKDTLNIFWPNPKKPTSPAQLLLRYSDMIRVHTIPDAADVEVVIAFFNTAAAECSPEQIHTYWIEPVAANLVHEIPFEAPSPNSPHLKALPMPELQTAVKKTSLKTEDDERKEKAKERFIFEAAAKIRELKKVISDRDEMIKELRSGGVGTAPPLPPPDAEALLDAFQERYFEARFQIRQFEIQIAALEEKGGTPQEAEALRQKMTNLITREKIWLRKIAQTLETHREMKKKASG